MIIGYASTRQMPRERLRNVLFGVCMLILTLSVPAKLNAQGCIVARSSEQPAGPETEGGYLRAGEWDFTVGYRHQFSFRHFVGPTEQTYRIQQGTQVMNKINLENFNLTYQATPRFSFSADVPLLLASRRSNNSPYTLTAQGIGDTIVSAQGWIWNPQENKRGNINVGIGMMIPTGKDDVKNTVDVGGGKIVTMPVDYSIQPGSGGWGIVFQWQAFKTLGSTSQAYFNGTYIATPQDYNGVARYTTSTKPNPYTIYNSISDEYLLEAGIAHAIHKVRGLSLTIGPREEGVPAHDLIGKSLGFRRPGFAISIEPGLTYVRNNSILSASIGKAIYRDRTTSVPDILTGGHGDAAFADYVWLATYSYRFGRQTASHDTARSQHSSAPLASSNSGIGDTPSGARVASCR